jgi:Histidine phosphatase superfamily (branch 1)
MMKEPERTVLWRRGYDIAPPNGESLKTVEERVWPFPDALLERIRREKITVALSAHRNSMPAIRRYFEHMEIEEALTHEKPLVPTTHCTPRAEAGSVETAEPTAAGSSMNWSSHSGVLCKFRNCSPLPGSEVVAKAYFEPHVRLLLAKLGPRSSALDVHQPSKLEVLRRLVLHLRQQ